jgi:uncharacterized protein
MYGSATSRAHASMGKILVLVLVVLAVIFIARTLGAASRRDPEEEKPGPRRVGKEERVVPCAQCGTHVPESAAVEWRGHTFCSDEHRRLFRE